MKGKKIINGLSTLYYTYIQYPLGRHTSIMCFFVEAPLKGVFFLNIMEMSFYDPGGFWIALKISSARYNRFRLRPVTSRENSRLFESIDITLGRSKSGQFQTNLQSTHRDDGVANQEIHGFRQGAADRLPANC